MSKSVPLALVLCCIAPIAFAGEAREPIAVMVDHAKVMRISAPAATVVIGNPAIADASIQDRQTIVLTGKVLGMTNLVILDAKGQLIADELIRVEKSEQGYVTVQRGPARFTYACTPKCNTALEPGDFNDYFTQSQQQMTARSALANGAAGPTQ